MEVSPEAQRFSEIHPLDENYEEMKKKFQELAEAGKIVDAKLEQPMQFTTVTGPKKALQELQDDLRKAGYRKLR